ncbi:MAG: porin family protein [Dysgonomonas sp.]
MKPIFKFPFLALAIVLGTNANAQTTTSGNGEGVLNYGVKVGVNFAGFNGKGAKDLDGKVGFNAGVFAEYTLPTNLYFLTGLEISAKGAKAEIEEDGGKYKETYSPTYLQLPIHAGYKLGLSDNITLGLHAGPYLAYGIGGKSKEEYTSDGDTEKNETDFFGSKEKGGAKSFDFGVGLGANVDINQFRIGLGYDMGLSNIDRSEESEAHLKNRNFFINVGYKF